MTECFFPPAALVIPFLPWPAFSAFALVCHYVAAATEVITQNAWQLVHGLETIPVMCPSALLSGGPLKPWFFLYTVNMQVFKSKEHEAPNLLKVILHREVNLPYPSYWNPVFKTRWATRASTGHAHWVNYPGNTKPWPLLLKDWLRELGRHTHVTQYHTHSK